MRMSLRVFFLLSLAFLLALLVFSLLYVGGDRSDLPGTDISHLSRGAVPGHVQALRSQDASARRKAAATLWQLGVDAKEATPALLEAAKDADPQVREAAVKAVGRTGQGTQDAIPGLIEALKDEHADVRAAAATSLAETWRLAGAGRSAGSRGPVGRNNPGERQGQIRSKLSLS